MWGQYFIRLYFLGKCQRRTLLQLLSTWLTFKDHFVRFPNFIYSAGNWTDFLYEILLLFLVLLET